MAFDKVVDSAKLESAITATADAIRAKTGSSEKIPWDADTGMKAAVEGIPEGGGGEGGPSAKSVEFGNVKKSETTEAPTGKAYFNGVLLPEIPAGMLDTHPYCWIRNNGDTGYYDLLFATGLWYCSSTDTLGHNDSDNVEWYRVEKASAETATEWTFNQSMSSSGWGDDANRVLIWSNQDIPNGSATATDIYFTGSDPVPEIAEVTNTWLEPVERLEAYSTTGDFLNGVAGYVQKFLGTLSLLTPQGMLDGLAEVKFIPQGRASSAFNLNGMFASGAVGILPDVQRGSASSSFNFDNMFTSSAVGALVEG